MGVNIIVLCTLTMFVKIIQPIFLFPRGYAYTATPQVRGFVAHRNSAQGMHVLVISIALLMLGSTPVFASVSRGAASFGLPNGVEVGLIAPPVCTNVIAVSGGDTFSGSCVCCTQ